MSKPAQDMAQYGAIALEADQNHENDLLRRLGYKQELKRTLSMFATFGISFASIGILCNISATFQTVLQRGGPLVMLVSWNMVAFFVLCLMLSMSEIASMYPTSGGIYYWVYELIHAHPRFHRHAPFMAFITGWTYVLANIIAMGANNVVCAMSFGALIRVISGYHLDSTGIMCLAIVTTLIQNLLNIHRMQYLAFLNQSNVVWSCAALLFTVLVMAIKSPHWNSLEWLVDTYENRTGFESTTYVFMLGMIGAAYSLFGAEGAASTTEESKNADLSTPIAMVCSITLSWFIGLVFLLILLLSLQDIDAILDAKLHIPVAQIFWDVAGKGGAAGFLLFITVSQFCTGTASMTVTSRMLFALARDQATPYSDALRRLDANRLPTCAVKFVFVSTILFGILPLMVSESAFDILVSSTTITSNMAYAMVMGCRLITNPSILEKGRFSIGWLSRPATMIAFAWTCFAVVIFMLPTSWPIEFATFNWSGIAGFAVVGVNLCLWFTWGRYHYTGPRASNDETA